VAYDTRVDNQHKELITALNNIINASQQGKGQHDKFKGMEFYTEFHGVLISKSDETFLSIFISIKI